MLNARQILSSLVTEPNTTSVFSFNQGADLESCQYVFIVAKKLHQEHLRNGALPIPLQRAFVAKYWIDTFTQLEPEQDAAWAVFNDLVKAGSAQRSPTPETVRSRQSPAFDRMLREAMIRPASTALFAITTDSVVLHLPPDLPEAVGGWPWHVQVAVAVFELLTNGEHIETAKVALGDLFPE